MLRRKTKRLSYAVRVARWLRPSRRIPEVCRLAETLLSEIIGLEVREHCNREGPPRCRFEVIGNETEKTKGGSNPKRLEREQIL